MNKECRHEFGIWSMGKLEACDKCLLCNTLNPHSPKEDNKLEEIIVTEGLVGLGLTLEDAVKVTGILSRLTGEAIGKAYQKGVEAERERIGKELRKWFNGKGSEMVEEAIERITEVKNDKTR